MSTHKINSKTDIRYFLANGLAPRKTLDFDIFGEKVSVTLTYDDEMEDVFILRTTVLKKRYYDFNRLIVDLNKLYDALKAA